MVLESRGMPLENTMYSKDLFYRLTRNIYTIVLHSRSVESKIFMFVLDRIDVIELRKL